MQERTEARPVCRGPDYPDNAYPPLRPMESKVGVQHAVKASSFASHNATPHWSCRSSGTASGSSTVSV